MTQFESVQETLGCKENKTLVAELSEILSKEVHPLWESFREVYSKVYIPQLEQQKVSIVACRLIYRVLPIV